MAYVKKDWQDLPSQTTPVTADDLDRIENGIEYNDQRLNGTKPIENTIYANDFKCKNLFNRSIAKPYFWLSNTGVISSNIDPVLTSAFIKVENGKQYTLSGIPDTYPIRVCSYTDINTFKTCLINYATDIKTFTTDAEYIVFAIGIPTGGNATTLPTIQLELGSEPTAYTPYKNFDNTPNAMVISRNGSEDINITTAYQHKTVSLDTIITKIGDKLTYNGTNKSIVIGSGVHHIEVSACVVMSHSSNNVSDRYFSIRKNSNDFVSSIYQILNTPANYVYTLNIPSIIVDVNSGDEIYATVTSGITETISIKGSTEKRVFLTVKVID